MRIERVLAAVALLAVTGMTSCGGSPPPAEPAPPPVEPPPAPPPEPIEPAADAPADAAPPPAPEPAKPTWAEMSKDQRAELMKTVVLPQMKAAFQEYDAKEFANMNCATCHGAGAKEGGDFKMPNPKLPKLDPKNGFEKHKKKDPKGTQFMMERVAPEMAKLLGVEPYNPETQQGFGCFNCHTMAGK